MALHPIAWLCYAGALILIRGGGTVAKFGSSGRPVKPPSGELCCALVCLLAEGGMAAADTILQCSE